MNDWQISEEIIGLRNPIMNSGVKWVTVLGNWQVVLAVGLVVALVLFYKKREYLGKWIATGISIGAVWWLKILIARQRPPKELALIEQGGYSFPSGHAYVAVAFWGLLVYWVALEIKNKWLRIIWIINGTGIMMILAGSRIYVGVHWFSDVMAGAALGGLWLVMMINKYRNVRQKQVKQV